MSQKPSNDFFCPEKVMAKFKIGDVVRIIARDDWGEGEVIAHNGCDLKIIFNDGSVGLFIEDELRLVARPVDKETEQAVDEALGLVSVQMRLPVELHEALKAIAEGKGWVLPAVMREALSLYAYQANT